jgi:CPA2 family monovalent cation:H+ antiporter-2
MPDAHLLNDIAIALALAFTGGFVARLIGVPAIVGYLLAGIVISPFTAGYDADLETLQQLAELGVIFLMFGVGLHFNLSDLARVRGIAVPGALLQILATTALGLAAGAAFGLDWREGLLLGLSVSVASTVVLIRALEDRGALDSMHGRVAIGWLIVEDLAAVFFLVLIPSLEPGTDDNFLLNAGGAVLKAAVFVAFMLIVGARVLPWLLGLVARTGSRELFILAVVASALGVATSASLFGLSVALGAFVAGVVVSETETSHQAAADVLPFRDAFAVLFFVSVGMLLDPSQVSDSLGLLIAVLLIVVVGTPLVAFLIASPFPYPVRTGLVVAAGLAQIGEFSFIVAQEGLDRELMSQSTYNVILAVSVASIAVNPLAFGLVPHVERLLSGSGRIWRRLDHQGDLPPLEISLGSHVIVAGYGRVGRLSGYALEQLGMPYVVVDGDITLIRELRNRDVAAVWGDVASFEVLHLARCTEAKILLLAVPDESTALLATANARRLNPHIEVVVRAPDGSSADALRDLGASEVVVPEYEGGLELMRELLVALGSNADEATRFAEMMRERQYAGELRLEEAVAGHGNNRVRRAYRR